MELTEDVREAITLPPEWRDNLVAVAEAPLACLPAKCLPHPARRTVESMRGIGLLAGWDRRREKLGLYVTLTPWAAECLGAVLARIPGQGRERRELEEQVAALDLTIAREEPVRWARPLEEQPPGQPTAGAARLAQASYQAPTIVIEDEANEPDAAPAEDLTRCATPGCGRRIHPNGVRHCLPCREAALRRVVRENDRQREAERKGRDRRRLA